jgi:hypothetical protein
MSRVSARPVVRAPRPAAPRCPAGEITEADAAGGEGLFDVGAVVVRVPGSDLGEEQDPGSRSASSTDVTLQTGHVNH